MNIYCDKENKDSCTKDCNLCIQNKEVAENIAVIRSCLKISLLQSLTKPELKKQINKTIKWVDQYLKKM